MANVQIPEELFFKLFRYHCLQEFSEADELEDLHQEISRAIEKKLDAMAMRQIYSQSKTATTAEEREQARQEYLNRKGIHKDFRW